MKYLTIGILALALCGCKGRTASVPESTGDTVEVIVNGEDPSATVDAESDSTFSVRPETESGASQAVGTPVYNDVSPAEASGKSVSSSETQRRRAEGDVSFGKAI